MAVKILCKSFKLKKMFKNLQKTYLIAEIGINHNGDIGIANKLLDAVSATGWDCAKFQKRNPDVCVPEQQKSVIRSTPWGEMTYLDYKYRVEFGKKEFDIINDNSKSRNIKWTASVWDYDSLDFMLQNYPDVPFLKIASATNGAKDFIVDACKTGIPIALSLGMSDISQCDEVVNLLMKNCSDYCIMHTNSAYPSPHEDLNLSLIPFFKDRYKCVVGYSGHEIDLEPTVIAAALGAEVIERHVTLDHSMWGSDHACSLEVHAMDMLRKRIETIKKVIGVPEKKVFESELPFVKKLKNDNIRRF
jgi:N-acetylneuraminate synthase